MDSRFTCLGIEVHTNMWADEDSLKEGCIIYIIYTSRKIASVGRRTRRHDLKFFHAWTGSSLLTNSCILDDWLMLMVSEEKWVEVETYNLSVLGLMSLFIVNKYVKVMSTQFPITIRKASWQVIPQDCLLAIKSMNGQRISYVGWAGDLEL